MLMLMRRKHEKIVIVVGDTVIKFAPNKIQPQQVQFGFEAPDSAKIYREEVYNAMVGPRGVEEEVRWPVK